MACGDGQGGCACVSRRMREAGSGRGSLGRPHRTDGGVRPEMWAHHGGRRGAPEENFGFLNAFRTRK